MIPEPKYKDSWFLHVVLQLWFMIHDSASTPDFQSNYKLTGWDFPNKTDNRSDHSLFAWPPSVEGDSMNKSTSHQSSPYQDLPNDTLTCWWVNGVSLPKDHKTLPSEIIHNWTSLFLWLLSGRLDSLLISKLQRQREILGYQKLF